MKDVYHTALALAGTLTAAILLVMLAAVFWGLILVALGFIGLLLGACFLYLTAQERFRRAKARYWAWRHRVPR